MCSIQVRSYCMPAQLDVVDAGGPSATQVGSCCALGHMCCCCRYRLQGGALPLQSLMDSLPLAGSFINFRRVGQRCGVLFAGGGGGGGGCAVWWWRLRRMCCLVMVAADVLFLHGACMLCCYVTSFLRRAAPNQIRGRHVRWARVAVHYIWRAAPDQIRGRRGRWARVAV